MNIDNAVIHLFPASPYVVKACLNLRDGNRIKLRFPLKDEQAANEYLNSRFADLPRRTITHC